MDIKEKINITPDKSIYPKLGQAGYTVAEALAELIDNSIDAREDRVFINVLINKKRGVIIVEDNSIGMNKEGAKESIILGKSNKKEGQLGQFGLGLKTACMGLGKRFKVETTTKDIDELYELVFDEEEFLTRGSWSDFEIIIKQGIDRNKSGTKIIIDKLKIKFYYNLVDVVRKHLSERFTPFIKNNEAIIKVNNFILSPEEVKIIPNTKKEFIIKLSNGVQIGGWTGILEVGSMENSGFNLYRYGRLIRAHEKLGYLYHPSKMWITGEINLDPIPVTHNKREFIKTDPLYIEFFDRFKNILKPLLEEAQQRHKEERIKDLPQELKETLKDNLLRALDKVDDFKELAFPSLAKRTENKNGILSEQEKREIKEKKITEVKAEKIIGEKGRIPNKTREEKVRFIIIAGKKYRFDWEWGKLDENVAKESYLDRDRGMIIIILNSRYRMLNVVKPDWFYHAIYVIEGIAEVFLKENKQPLDKVIALRDKTAKQLADICSEEFEEQTINKENQVMEAQSYLLKIENKSEINSKKLTEHEKKVLHMRLEEGLPMQEIANLIDVARQRVYQIFDSALGKITKIDKKLKKPKRISASISTLHIGFRKNESDIMSVITKISESYGVKAKDLIGHKRNKELVLPRHMIMYILRKRLKFSFPKIAKIMDRNHTTIMHACDRIDKLIKGEAKQKVEELIGPEQIIS